MSLETGRRVMRVTAEAIAAAGERLGSSFEEATRAILAAEGRVVLTGMGKSGLIARKIAATFASTGTPSLFLHPAEAIHGDLGMVVGGDVVLAISQGGESEEVLRLVEQQRRLGGVLIVMTGRAASSLGREADVLLDTNVVEEGCPLDLAPMASTSVALALGDALAAALMLARGFSAEDFARLHPGGRLGRGLRRVETLMHAGEELPRVGPRAPMSEVVLEISAKRLGCTTVLDEEGRLLGVITDGDVRRLVARGGRAPFEERAQSVMTREPLCVGPDTLASAALAAMEERKITMIPIIDEERRVLGVLHIHDLWGTQLF